MFYTLALIYGLVTIDADLEKAARLLIDGAMCHLQTDQGEYRERVESYTRRHGVTFDVTVKATEELAAKIWNLTPDRNAYCLSRQ